MKESKLQVYKKLAQTKDWQHRKFYSLSEQEKYWLRGNQSLTNQLTEKSDSFEVNVLGETLSTPLLPETQKLDCEEDKVKIREVELICNGEAAVYARSIIPVSALNGVGSKLDKLGNKPLGHLLFKQAKVDIETRDIAKISVQDKQQWARRTIYRFNDTNILVSEFFLFELS